MADPLNREGLRLLKDIRRKSISNMNGGNEMKNKLTDLNDHLFAEMERLGDEDLTGDALIEEIGRAKAIADIATRITSNAALVLKAAESAVDSFNANYRVPDLIGIEKTERKRIEEQG